MKSIFLLPVLFCAVLSRPQEDGAEADYGEASFEAVNDAEGNKQCYHLLAKVFCQINRKIRLLTKIIRPHTIFAIKG
jgi:hypothetical protein